MRPVEALEKEQVEQDGLPPKTTSRTWPRTFVSLSNRNFRLYWMGMFVSFMGLQMQMLAQNYLVYDMTDKAVVIGYVSAASGGSILVFSLLGGAIADRVGKRNLMATTQAGIAVATLVLAVLISTGGIEVWHLMVGAIIIGVIAAFNMPARQSFVPELVGKRHLMNALALTTGGMNLSRVAAPALAGILIAVVGVGTVYYIKVVAYAIFILTLLMVPVMGRASSQSRTSVPSAMKEGLVYTVRNRIILTLLIMGLVPIVFGMPYVFLLPVFQKDVLDVGASGLGYLMSAVGVGAVMGALFVAWLGDFRRKGLLLLVAGAAFGLALVLFAFLSSTGSFPLSLASLLLVGAASSAYMAVNNTLVQTIVPDEVRGRVMGLYMMTFGLNSFGTLPAGAVADSMGAPVAVGAGGVIIALFIVAVALTRPAVRNL